MYLYYVLMSLHRLGSSCSIFIAFTFLRENRGSHSHHYFGLLVLASFFTVSTHPLTSSFVFNPTYYLTYGMEDLFPARTFLGQISIILVFLGSELVIELAFGELYCMPKSFWSVLPMFGTVQNSPSHLRCCWLKLKAHVLPILKILNMRPWKIKNLKLCFLTYVKRARAMKC